MTVTRRTALKACTTAVAAAWAWTFRAPAAKAAPQRVKWIAFYGQTADEQVLATYDIVVLDPMFMGSIAAVAKAGARLYGYLSLGETRTTDTFYERIDRAVLLAENPAWPNTRQVDVRQRAWKDLVIQEMIPAIAAKGFTGLMLDTLDTPPYLEQVNPRSNRGMTQAAVDLVKAIREAHPNMAVIMNRGYALLPRVVGVVDAIVAESLLTTTDERSGGYVWNEGALVAQQLSLLAPARDRSLPILSLDYWEPSDTRTIDKIYSRQRLLGHHPYVATRTLDKIYSEPASGFPIWMIPSESSIPDDRPMIVYR
jgi:polysaccharide biosynthesis protein PelA